MAICPSCGRDRFNKRQYTTSYNPQRIKIYWACTNCGLTEEGYWTTALELQETQRRAAQGEEDSDSSDGE